MAGGTFRSDRAGDAGGVSLASHRPGKYWQGGAVGGAALRLARLKRSLAGWFGRYRLPDWGKRKNASSRWFDGSRAVANSSGTTFPGRWLLRVLGCALCLVFLGDAAGASEQTMAGSLRIQSVLSCAYQGKRGVCLSCLNG